MNTVYENSQPDARQGASSELEGTPGEWVFRKRYRQLEVEEVDLHDGIKDAAVHLYDLIESLPKSREQSVAKTKLEEAVMWAVKGLTA